MGKVFVDISMSLDGFMAGINDGPTNPLGDGGERILGWVHKLSSWREQQGIDGGSTNLASDILNDSIKRTGAEVMGKRMFMNGEKHWGNNPPFKHPVFIITHGKREKETKDGGTLYTFVTDGIENALEQAKEAAGKKDVKIAGGAEIVQQFVKADLINEINIHLIPILLGKGIRLFDRIGKYVTLEKTKVTETDNVIHLTFRVLKKEGK